MALTFFFHDTVNWNTEKGKEGRKKEIDIEDKKGRVKERLAGRQTWEGRKFIHLCLIYSRRI